MTPSPPRLLDRPFVHPTAMPPYPRSPQGFELGASKDQYEAGGEVLHVGQFKHRVFDILDATDGKDYDDLMNRMTLKTVIVKRRVELFAPDGATMKIYCEWYTDIKAYPAKAAGG